MNKPISLNRASHKQRGAAVVEFALVAMLFFTLLLGIIELGRMLYVWNTAQEVTRNAARQATVSDFTDSVIVESILRNSIFQAGTSGTVTLPGSPEITCAGADDCTITISYLNANRTPANPLPISPSDNMVACKDPSRTNSCIQFVQASIGSVTYTPLIAGLFPFHIPVPASTATIPAEALGIL